MTVQPAAQWDVQFTIPVGELTGSLYYVGIGFDGTYFYCPEFATSTIHQFNMDGTVAGSFTISGVPNLIDLTYDGTYFYGQGQSPTNVIYKMDFTTHTLVGTIPSPHAAWNIAYDAEHDGFWIGQWQNYLSLIDRSGNTLDTISPVPDSMLGMAWDPYTQIEGYDGPFLWISTGTSSGMSNIIKVIDLATKTLVPGVSHDVAAELGAGMAGGLDLVTNYVEGTATLIGITQGTTNDYAYGYEIAPTTPPEHPPVTTISLNGTLDGDHYTSAVTVTLTATDVDSTPVNATYYKVDSGAWTVYTAPFVVSTAGDHTVQYYSDDTAGNIEEVKTAAFKILFPLTITIKGGMGITATINNGGAEATDMDITISVTGLVFPKTKAYTETAIAPGADAVEKMTVFGIGPTLITVTANGVTKTASGFALIVFVLGVK